MSGGTTNRYYLNFSGTAAILSITSALGDDAAVSGGPGFDDGTEHLVYSTYKQSLVTLYDDSTSVGTPDTSFDIAAALDGDIAVGHNGGGALQVDGHLSECFWYSEIVQVAP